MVTWESLASFNLLNAWSEHACACLQRSWPSWRSVDRQVTGPRTSHTRPLSNGGSLHSFSLQNSAFPSLTFPPCTSLMHYRLGPTIGLGVAVSTKLKRPPKRDTISTQWRLNFSKDLLSGRECGRRHLHRSTPRWLGTGCRRCLAPCGGQSRAPYQGQALFPRLAYIMSWSYLAYT